MVGEAWGGQCVHMKRAYDASTPHVSKQHTRHGKLHAQKGPMAAGAAAGGGGGSARTESGPNAHCCVGSLASHVRTTAGTLSGGWAPPRESALAACTAHAHAHAVRIKARRLMLFGGRMVLG